MLRRLIGLQVVLHIFWDFVASLIVDVLDHGTAKQ
jgi:hypothetical protein